MGATPKNNAKTKDALADALVNLLTHEQPLAKIRIKQLTDLCGVDRQTFYYYFKNLPELVQYTYEREASKLLVAEDNGSDPTGWKTRIRNALKFIEDNPSLRKMITPSLSDHTVRQELRRVIASELEQFFLPHLLDAGMDERLAWDRTDYLSYMFESVLMSWLNEDIDKDPDDILDHIEEMLVDYTNGVHVRIQGERAATATR